MLNIILEPAQSAGTHRLCKEMVASAAAHPSSCFIAIVPEQATLQMQRLVVEEHPAHAVFNIDIVSFERLAHKVFEELGYPESDILNDTGKVLILRKVLEDCREDLLLYKKKVHMPGFAGEMKSAVTELKQYAIDDNDLFLMQDAAQRDGNRVLYDKLQDLRLIYRRFNEALQDQYTTQEERLEVLARLAGRSELLHNAHLYLDGFTGFTPVQYKLLKELMKCAAEMTLTITMPVGTDVPVSSPSMDELSAGAGANRNDQEQDLFLLSSQTLQKLQMLAQQTDTPVQITAGEPLGFLPKAFVYEAADPRQEVLFAARKILEGVRSGQKRFRDYAVICSDMDTYHPLVREVFAEAGIAGFIDYKSELDDNALARFLIAAMQVVTEQYSYDSVFALLKSGMSDLSLDEINRLENYCLEFGIRGTKIWTNPFTRNRRRYTETDSEEPVYVWDLQEINQLRERAVRKLARFTARVRGAGKTAEEYSEALKELMERSGIKEHMARKSEESYARGEMSRGKEYEQIYPLMTQLLDQISRLMGGQVISSREYGDILTGALGEIKVGIIPPSLDAVAVGDLTRTRLSGIAGLFLLGVNDGKLPGPPSHAGVFTQQERQFLKQEQFELAPTALENLYTQHFYLYLLMTRPKEQLYLTYAVSDGSGQEQLPSYLIDGVEEILPGLSPEPVGDPPEEVSGPSAGDSDQILWPCEAARKLAAVVRDLARDCPKTSSGGSPAPTFARIPSASATDVPTSPPSAEDLRLLRYFALEDPRIFHQVLAGAFYCNQPLPLDPQTVTDLYGEVLQGSVSRYETFYACPFRYYMNYGLHLKERPEYQIQATDIGTVYHDSLENYARKLKERGLTFRDVSDEASREIVREAVQEAASAMESDVLMSTERSAYLLRRMTEVTEKTTDVLRLHVRQGLYEPEAFEFAFHEEDLEGQKLKGKIDRVDIYDGGDLYVKIIDYKSGNKKFSIRDLYTGQQLQLVAYLSAAIKEQRKRHPDRTVKAGGVYYYLIQDRFVKSEKEAEEKFRMSGLTNCDPAALQAIDLTAGAGLSSKIVEISYTRKGGLGNRSKVANDGEFEHLMAFADGKIREVGTRVRDGDVSIHPSYESSSKHACIYCEYRDICKFEPGKWGSDYQKLPDQIQTEDMEREIYGRNNVDKRSAESN